MPAHEAAPAPTRSGALTHRQITVIIIGLMSGMLLAALDQTIVATSIRTIGDDLHGLSAQAWVTTAYLITSTVTTPLYGKLSDIYGRRPLFLIAITLFIIGSAASAFSTSMYELAAFRAFQGLGAGGLFSMALAIVADIVPPRQRAKYQGYFLAVFGTSSVVGPVVGGFFAGASSILGITGWRWVFLVNVPIGIIALIVVSKVLHLPHIRHDHRIDWWGAAALVVGLVPVLIVAEQGNSWGWASGGVLGLIALGILGLAAFVFVEFRMGDEALIPMRLFRSKVFSIGLGAGLLVGLGMFGALSCLPLYLQIAKGASPTEAGLLMLPMMLGIMISSVASGQLTMRTGRYKIFPVIGVAMLVIAFALLLTVTVDTAYWKLDLIFLLIGGGLGLNMQTLTIAVQNAVPAKDIGVATASATFFRQVGGTLGVAVFLSLLFNSLPDKISSAMASAFGRPEFQAAVAKAAGSTDQATIQQYLAGLGGQMSNDSAFLQKIDPAIARPFQEGFVSSTHLVYLLAGILMVVAFFLVLALKEIPLRTMSAIEERQAEEAALAASEGLDPSELAAVSDGAGDGPAAGPHGVGAADGHAVGGGPADGVAGDGVSAGSTAHGTHRMPAGAVPVGADDGVLHRGGGVVTIDVPDEAAAGDHGRHER
jgi:EmrB/QacA subfamily drug resistance transporter